MSYLVDSKISEYHLFKWRRNDANHISVEFPMGYGNASKVFGNEVRSKVNKLTEKIKTSASKNHTIYMNVREADYKGDTLLSIFTPSDNGSGFTSFRIYDDERSRVFLDKLLYALLTDDTTFRNRVSRKWGVSPVSNEYKTRIETLTPLRGKELVL